MMRNALLLGTTTVLLMACGAAPPPPASTGQSAPGAAAIVADEPGDARGRGAHEPAGNYDVSPVSEPAVPIFHLRWKSPGATVDGAARFARLPAAFVNANVRKLVEEAVRDGLGDMVDAHEFAAVVDLDAPIDIVIMANATRMSQIPQPLAAISVGLTSLGRARGAAKGKQRKLAEGVWRIGPDRDWGDACALAAAAGRAPARLVCADDEGAVTRLAPYLARNVAALPEQRADVHGELNLRPLFDRYGRQWANQARGLPIFADEFKIGNRRFDEAVMQAASALSAEAAALIHDADKLSFDASLDQTRGLDALVDLSFVGKRSWVAASVADAAAVSGPAPAIFWRLPRNSAFASYSRTTDPARYEPILRNLRALIEGGLQQEKIGSAADRRAIAQLLRLPFGKNVGTVAASGHFGGVTKKVSPSAVPSIVADLLDAAFGWSVFGVEESPAALRRYLRELVRVYNRPGLQSLMKKEMGSDADHLPVVKVVRAPRALGAGALDVSITVPKVPSPMAGLGGPAGRSAGGAPKTTSVSVHVLMMADGRRTWMGFAADPDALAKLMAGFKGSAPARGTLASDPRFARFRTEPHASVSVTSLNGAIGAVKPLLDLASSVAPGSVQGVISQVTSLIEHMPNQGRSPIVITADASGGGAPRSHGHVSVPRGTLEDIGHLVAGGLSIANQLEH